MFAPSTIKTSHVLLLSRVLHVLSISYLDQQPTQTNQHNMPLHATESHVDALFGALGGTDRHTDRQTTQASLGTELNTISDSLTKPMEGKTRALASRRSNVEAAQNRSHG